MNPFNRNAALWIVIVLLLALLYSVFQGGTTRTAGNTISYSDFEGTIPPQQYGAGKVINSDLLLIELCWVLANASVGWLLLRRYNPTTAGSSRRTGVLVFVMINADTLVIARILGAGAALLHLASRGELQQPPDAAARRRVAVADH